MFVSKYFAVLLVFVIFNQLGISEGKKQKFLTIIRCATIF